MARWNRWTGIVAVTAVLAALAACGADATGPKASDISGSWQLTATINNASLGISCQAGGDVFFTQTGQTFTGQVTGSTEVCSSGAGSVSGNADGPFSGDQITGNTVTYTDDVCTYSGTISGTPAKRLAGVVRCSFSFEGQTYPFRRAVAGEPERGEGLQLAGSKAAWCESSLSRSLREV